MTETNITPVSAIPPPPPPPASRGLFGSGIPVSIGFILGVLVFLMPFVEIKCNAMVIQSITGLELATGFKVKSGNDDSLFGKLEDTSFGQKKVTPKGDIKDANMFALGALVLGVLGILVSFIKTKFGTSASFVLGLLSAAGLIGLMIDVSMEKKKEIPTAGQLDPGTVISIDFTAWYFIAVLAFLVAAFFSYKRMKMQRT